MINGRNRIFSNSKLLLKVLLLQVGQYTVVMVTIVLLEIEFVIFI